MSDSTIRNLILSALALVASISVFTFVMLEIGQKEQVLQEQLQLLNKGSVREHTYYKLQKTADESTPDRDKLGSYFLKQESDSIDVLNWIETTAPKAHVKLETKSLQKISDKETKADWIEVSFAFSGQQRDVERFVSILEKLPYSSYITALTMSARSANDWDALVTLRVYIFKYGK